MTARSDRIALQVDKIIASKKQELGAWQTFRRAVLTSGDVTHDAVLALNNAIHSARDVESEATTTIDKEIKRLVDDHVKSHSNAYPSRQNQSLGGQNPSLGGACAGPTGASGGPGPVGTNPANSKLAPLTVAEGMRKHDVRIVPGRTKVHACYIKTGRNYVPNRLGDYIHVGDKYVRIVDHHQTTVEPFSVMIADGSIRTFYPTYMPVGPTVMPA